MSSSMHWQNNNIAEKYKLAESATRPYADIMAQNAKLGNYEGQINAFDLACGTGSMVASIYDAVPRDKWNSTTVFGGDINESMLEYLKERGQEEGWVGLQTAVVDGNNMNLPSNTYTHVFQNFGLFFTEAESNLKACLEALQPGGFIAFTTWVSLGWYPCLCKAVSQLPNSPPCPTEQDINDLFFKDQPWGSIDYEKKLLSEAGFQDIEVETHEREVIAGTPKQFAETLSIMRAVISKLFGENGDEVSKQAIGKMEEIFTEEFGEEGPIRMKWTALVATGRKTLSE